MADRATKVLATIRNALGNTINPSTEDKQDDAIVELKNILGFQIPFYDEIVLTYVASGNGAGEIETVVYKLATATQATLTLSYDANNKLSSVVQS
jgi:hypothetical protein